VSADGKRVWLGGFADNVYLCVWEGGGGQMMRMIGLQMIR